MPWSSHGMTNAGYGATPRSPMRVLLRRTTVQQSRLPVSIPSHSRCQSAWGPHPPASSPPPCVDPHDGCLNRSPALPTLPVARSPHGGGDGVRVNGSHRDAPGRQTRPGHPASATCQINVEKPAQKRCNPLPFLLKALPFGHIAPKAGIAQLVEHLICNQGVTGSNPVAGTSFKMKLSLSLICKRSNLKRELCSHEKWFSIFN
jgi:hypothetical protein